jgi:hypothetical protein
MKNKITFLCSNFVLVVFISLFSFTIGYAQGAKVYELFENNYNGTNVASKSALKANTNNTSQTYTDDLNKFYDLNYNLKPTIYINNNVIVKAPANEAPVKVKLEDTNSFNILKSYNPLFETVELIIINVENSSGLNTSIDVSLFQSFTSLKYIYVQCNQFTSSVNQIQNFITNAGSDVTIYFMTLNPS